MIGVHGSLKTKKTSWIDPRGRIQLGEVTLESIDWNGKARFAWVWSYGKKLLISLLSWEYFTIIVPLSQWKRPIELSEVQVDKLYAYHFTFLYWQLVPCFFSIRTAVWLGGDDWWFGRHILHKVSFTPSLSMDEVRRHMERGVGQRARPPKCLRYYMNAIPLLMTHLYCLDLFDSHTAKTTSWDNPIELKQERQLKLMHDSLSDLRARCSVSAVL